MVLVTGPTGSGKTNTLYSSVAQLNTLDTNIMTAEDPVEFQLAGINQVQMKEQIGLNFASALARFFAAGPQHHSGRRNPRLRNGGNRRESRTHRPLGAVDAAHERCALDDQPLDEHGHRAVPGGDFGEPDLRAATGAAHLFATAKSRLEVPEQALIDAGYTTGRSRRRPRFITARAAEPATRAGYKGPRRACTK